ncbi:hypothetical protein H0A71_05165 [Alcaligenaceae bacterium]|nr:hypothetical protein [Alcaligenaceae bacterium]
MTDSQLPPLVFTSDELDLLGNTADALSAYMGKPVLAELMDAEETGFEWVIFAVPLDIEEDPEDITVVQIGGKGARLLGNKGGMDIEDGDVYDCECLWAIQLSDLDPVRFIKVDQSGEEVAWTDTLAEILPFVVQDEGLLPDDDDDDEQDDADDDNGPDDDAEGADPFAPYRPRTLH